MGKEKESGKEESDRIMNATVEHGHVRTPNGNWRPIEYVPFVNGIQIEEPAEVIDDIAGVTVDVKLANGDEKSGFAGSGGRVTFR
jgi:hypothetical protein